MKTIKVTEKEVQAAFDAAKSEETKQILTTLFGPPEEKAKPIINNYKHFDLEEYQKNPNRKVITRSGRNVRIICTDKRKDDYPILALCSMDNGSEHCYSYLPNGKRYLIEDSSVDLFFAPGKHEGWVNLFNLSEGPCLGRVYSSKEVAESMIGKCGLHPYIATVKIEWEE